MSQDTDTSIEEKINAATNRILVICVDRDDDIGQKTGIQTPVIGRDACIEAAQRLALEDPEDADSNAIFSAVRTYEDLVSKGYRVEVIAVTGNKNRGVQADQKIVKETRQALEKFAAGGAVIVSDGEDDESVIPIIQNVVPVVSVQRVVMKVSRSVEYSYAVFGKYLKMIAYDSKYSKFFLGVPGILLVIAGIGTILGLTAEIVAILASILGGAFLIRAFDIDKAWSRWAKPTPAGFIRIFTMVTGIIFIIASIPAGVTVVEADLTDIEAAFPDLIFDKVIIGQFIAGALPILWIGVGAIFGGTLLSNWLTGASKRIGDVLRLVVLGSLYPTVAQFTSILIHDQSSFTLIPPLLAGLAVTLISATILFRKYKKQRGGEMVSDEA